MPIPEGPIDERERDLRDGLSSPGTSPIVEPPEPIFTFPPLPDSVLDEVHTELDKTAETCASVEVAILTDVIDQLTKAESVSANVAAVILGEISVRLDKIDTIEAKCRKKITDDLQNTLGLAYGYSARLGMEIPNERDLAYATQTGDYLGSVPDAFREIDLGPGTDPTIDSQRPQPLPFPMPDGKPDSETPSEVPIPPSGDTERGPAFPGTGTTPGQPFDPVCNSTTAYGDYFDWPTLFSPTYNPNPQPGTTLCYPVIRWRLMITHSECFPLSKWFTGYDGYRPSRDLDPPIKRPKCLSIPACHSTYFPGVDRVRIAVRDKDELYIDLRTGILWGITGAAPPQFYKVQSQPCPSGPSGPIIIPGQIPAPTPTATCVPLCQPVCPPAGEGKPGEDKPGEKVCETDENEWCDEEEKPKPVPPIPAKDDYCEMVAEYVKSIDEQLPGVGTYLGFRKAKTEAGGFIQRQILAAIGLPKAILPSLTGRLLKWINKVVTRASEGLNCDRDKMIPLSLMGAALKFIQKYTAVVPEATIRTHDQMMNTVCQSEIPAVGDANLSYLNGTFTKEQWECYVKANGFYTQPMEQVMRSGRKKPVAEEFIKLFRREYIKKPEFDKLIKTAGVIDEQDKDFLLKVTEAWPTTSDGIRFMQRDTADEKNVDWKEVDKVFEDKYTGRVKKYLDAIGLTREIALDHWRAHFHLPSFTMGAEMFHRLRPGVVDKKLEVDETKLRNLLIQDDWHPDWIPKLIAIAYKTVTRTDATRAYMIHAITDEELKKRFLDFGYNEDSADFYVKYHKRNREIMDRRRSGYPTLRMLSNQYARCEIAESEFRNTIAQLVLSEEQEKAAIEASVLSRTVRKRQQTIRAVRRPFVQGIIDEAEAQKLLQDAEVDGRCISGLIEIWNLDRLRQDKRLNAGTLCSMREFGIITPAEQVVALIRTGWSRDDAIRITELCGASLTMKAQKKAEIAARRAASEQRRLAAEAKKRLRELECGPPDCPKNTPGGKVGSNGQTASPGNPTDNTGANSPVGR